MTTTRAITAKSLLAGTRGFYGDTSRPDCPAVGEDDDACFMPGPGNLERMTRLQREGDHYVVTISQHGNVLGRADVVQTDGIWNTDVIWQLADDTVAEAAARLREAVGPQPEAQRLDSPAKRREMEEFVRAAQTDSEAVENLADELTTRFHDAICVALEAGFTAYRLSQWTGISQPTIAKIRDRGSQRRTWTGLDPVAASRRLARRTWTLVDAPVLTDARGRAFTPDRVVVREISDHDGAHQITVHGLTRTGTPATIVWIAGLPDGIDVPRLEDAPTWVRTHVAAALAERAAQQ